MLIDSHCHLQLIDYRALKSDLKTVIQTAAENGVEHMLCVSTTLNEVEEIYTITDAYAQVSGSVGLHPNEKVEIEPTIEQLLTLAAHPKIVAIGETGLDYYRSDKHNHWQQERFIKQITAAKILKKPLIIHTRQAKKDTLALLASEAAHEVGGVLHCFTEDWETATAAMDMGFYISFSGILTFKNALEIQEVARKMPLDRILIETDAPYLAPVPHRGKINQPVYVKQVAECLAHLRHTTLEIIAQHTTENFYQLF